MRMYSFVVTGAALLVFIGCSKSDSTPASSSAMTQLPEVVSKPVVEAKISTRDGEEHGHQAGTHGGIVVSLGRDSYHVEAIVMASGELRLYTLGNDESRVLDVETQELVAYVKASGENDSISVQILPQPQPGDAKGKASLFVAKLPEELVGQSLDVTVPNISIGGERFRLGFTTKTEDHAAETMPGKVADDAERQLYLTPAGLYTQADIEANGNVTASEKFAAFQAAHDLKPKIGDKLCPVTLTKANPKCSWIVGGKTYEFCCPPCVDEFVGLAKTQPEEVKQPDYYVKRAPATGSPLR